MSDPTNMYATLRETLDAITRAPTTAESATLKALLVGWFGAESIEHSLFPGPHAVGLEPKHEADVGPETHFVTFKVDGLALVLVAPRVTERNGEFCETCFLVDRTNTVRALDGLRLEYGRGRGPVVLDGELVFRRRFGSRAEAAAAKRETMAGYAEEFEHRPTLPHDRETFSLDSHELLFVVTDCPVLRVSIADQPLPLRLQMARHVVEEKLPLFRDPARHADAPKPVAYTRDAARVFQIVYKPHQHGRQFGMLRTDIYPFLVGVPVDGFILTPIKDPYKPGNAPRLFKLKPVGQASVDAVVRPVASGVYAMYFRGPERAMIRWNRGELRCDDEFGDKTIVEIIRRKGQLCALRVRKDKRYPNSLRAAVAIIGGWDRPVSYDQVEQWMTVARGEKRVG